MSEDLDKCPRCGKNSVTTYRNPNRKINDPNQIGDVREHHCKTAACGWHSRAEYVRMDGNLGWQWSVSSIIKDRKDGTTKRW